MTKKIIVKEFYQSEIELIDEFYRTGYELKDNEKLIATHMTSNVANRRAAGGYHDMDIVLIIEVTEE